MIREEFNSLKHNIEVTFKKTGDIMDDNIEHDKKRHGKSYFFRYYDLGDGDLCYCADNKDTTDESLYLKFYIDEIELV